MIYMTFLGGVFGPFLQEKEQEAGPKHPLKKSYRSYFRRAQIRWVIWPSSISGKSMEIDLANFWGAGRPEFVGYIGSGVQSTGVSQRVRETGRTSPKVSLLIWKKPSKQKILLAQLRPYFSTPILSGVSKRGWREGVGNQHRPKYSQNGTPELCSPTHKGGNRKKGAWIYGMGGISLCQPPLSANPFRNLRYFPVATCQKGAWYVQLFETRYESNFVWPTKLLS